MTQTRLVLTLFVAFVLALLYWANTDAQWLPLAEPTRATSTPAAVRVALASGEATAQPARTSTPISVATHTPAPDYASTLTIIGLTAQAADEQATAEAESTSVIKTSVALATTQAASATDAHVYAAQVQATVNALTPTVTRTPTLTATANRVATQRAEVVGDVLYYSTVLGVPGVVLVIIACIIGVAVAIGGAHANAIEGQAQAAKIEAQGRARAAIIQAEARAHAIMHGNAKPPAEEPDERGPITGNLNGQAYDLNMLSTDARRVLGYLTSLLEAGTSPAVTILPGRSVAGLGGSIQSDVYAWLEARELLSRSGGSNSQLARPLGELIDAIAAGEVV